MQVQIFIKIGQVDQKYPNGVKYHNGNKNPEKDTGANFHENCTSRSKVNKRGLTTNISTS